MSDVIGVHVTAYSPLGSRDRQAALKSADEPALLDIPVIGAIAAKHGCSPAQVLIAWHLQSGISTIPKSVSPERLRDNLAAADQERISGLDQQLRLVDGSFWLLEGGPWTLATLWDEH